MSEPKLLQPGAVAPDFTTTTTDGSTFHLHDVIGKKFVVLYFYPRDFTGGCTREACEFRDAKLEYDSVNTVVYGVSTDDQESHAGFAAKHNLNFPLLVDKNQAICNLYGVPLHEDEAARVTFIIGLDGKIARTYEHVDARIHAAEVLTAIRELSK